MVEGELVVWDVGTWNQLNQDSIEAGLVFLVTEVLLGMLDYWNQDGREQEVCLVDFVYCYYHTLGYLVLEHKSLGWLVV